MTQPTPQDIENAGRRQSTADHFRREYEDALALVKSALGPGWVPTGRHMLVEKDEEARARKAGGRMTPAAVVYAAWKGGVEKLYTLADGVATECATVEAGFGSMYHAKHPTQGFEHRGQWIPYQRYSLYWSGYEAGYKPRSAEQLAAARVRREERAVEREAEAAPLFAEMIREEGFVARKGRPR